MSSPNFTPYTEVLVILKRDGEADNDLSGAWSTIEYTDGLPQSCKIILNSAYGQYMTVAPIIVKFDKIYVRITDARGNILEDVFQVKTIKRSRKPGKNKQLTLFCPHQSDNLWKRTIGLVARRTSGFDALNRIVGQLNVPQGKGTLDPDVEVPANDTVRKVGNFLDQDTSNNYIFEAVKLQTAFDEISDIEQQPIEGGGSFEAIFIRFKSKYDHDNPSDADLNTVQLQAFPQGFQDDGGGQFTNIPNVTLIHQPLLSGNTPPTNVLSTDSDEDPELATNLHLIADKNSGSYLVNWTQYHGAKNVFDSAKLWASGQNYFIGNLVSENNLTYECKTDHVSSGGNQPPSGVWIQRFFVKPAIWNFGTNYAVDDLVRRLNISWKCVQAHNANNVNEPPNEDFWIRIFYAPAVDYSPLTKANVQNWVNALAASKYADGGASDANKGKVKIIDPNVIIQDADHPRTHVRIVTDDPSNIPSIHKIAGVDIPDAYRVLAINPANGNPPAAGIWGPGETDSNGVSFGGNIVEFIDPDLDGNGEWVVLKSKVLQTDQEVFDWEEGVQWIKNPCVPNTFGPLADRGVDDNGNCVFIVGGAAGRASTWVKGSYFLIDIALTAFGIFNEDAIPQCAHSVAWDESAHNIDMGNEKILDDDIDGDSAVFIRTEQRITAPITLAEINRYYVGFNFHSLWPLTGQDDGAFSGSGSAGSDIALPTFDFNNMFRDHFGVESWFGPQSEDYLPIQAFAFWLKLIIDRNPVVNLINITEGDYAFGIWMADRRDNIRIIDDLVQPRREYVFSQEGKLPGKPFKGVPGISSFLKATEPDTTDAFDPREFLVGGIYTRDSFDGQGRYSDVFNRFNNQESMTLSLDGYRFIKPLITTNADVLQDKPTRNIGTQFIKKQSITSYAQAKNLVLGLSRIFNFERKEFKEGTGGRCDIQFGDSVYYTDSEEIPDTTDSLANTIKGVNTKNVISLSKGKSGPGGFTNLYELVTRIWP